MRLPVQVLENTSVRNKTGFWEFPVPGGLVLAAPRFDGLFLLNRSAGFIWAELRSGAAPEAIAQKLAVSFGIAPERARQDVETTLAEWNRTVFAARSALPQPPEDDSNQTDPGGCRRHDYLLHGRRFRIAMDSAALEAEITPRLSHLESAYGADPDFTLSLHTRADAIRISRGSTMIGLEETVSAARAILLQELVRLANGERDWLALLHAGACSLGDACVVFPAPSGAGKSTLAAVLEASGLALHADDSVGLFSGTRDVPPMPFRAAIREGSWPVLSKRRPGFDALPVFERFGQQVRFVTPVRQGGIARMTALAFPQYEPGSATRITRLETFEALLHLKASGFWVEHSRESIGAFLECVKALPAYRIIYSDIDAAVLFFRRILTAAN